MRLKSIKLAGFKSFVDATTVSFISNMTAVVGPNGCGKSNIIDAVRWVMGESSAKNLRGESMTDVIFNGSGGRQPVGQATIELLFENNEGKLQGEYAAFSEISIKRKVTRDGVSQYYLNGAKCRRRDVTGIFLGTGMGSRSYAIIEQGMISKLIESKPEELRVYLEEAAGISKYKERRRETENRMNRTQENLARLSDIREELGKQLQHLKRQASAAERYAILKKEQRWVNAQLNAFKWRLLERELVKKTVLISELELNIEKTLYAKTSNENDIELFRVSLGEKQAEFNHGQAKYYQSGADVASLEQQLKFKKERQLEQDRALASLVTEADSIQQSLNSDSEQLAVITIELDDIFPLIEESEECALGFESELESKEYEMRTWQDEWDQFNAKSANARQASEVELHKIKQYESRIRQHSERKEKLSMEHLELLSKFNETEHGHLSLKQTSLAQRIDTIQHEYDALYPQIILHREQIESCTKQCTKLSNSLSEKKAVLASLLVLQEASLGEKVEAQSNWLASKGYGNTHRLMDQVSVTSGWEAAIEHVLGFCLTAPIIDSFESLTAEDLDVTQCSITLINKSAGSDIKVRANSLAVYVEGAEALIGFLNSIHVVSTFDEAMEALPALSEGESVITPNGIWVSRQWLRCTQVEQSQEGLVLRTKKISQLELDIPVIEQNLFNEEASAKQFKGLLNDNEIKSRNLDKQLKSLVQEQGYLNSEISAQQIKRDQYQQRITRNERDAKEVCESIFSEQYELSDAKERWQIELTLLDELLEEKNTYTARRESLQRHVDEGRQRFRSLQAQTHQLKLDQQKKQNQKQSLEQSLLRAKELLLVNQQKAEQLNKNDHIEESALEDLALNLEGLLEAQLVNEHRVTDQRHELEAISKKLRDAESDREKFDESIQGLRNELGILRMDAQAFEIQRGGLAEQIVGDNFTVENMLISLALSDSEDSLNANLSNLASKIQRLGAINLAAIEEFKIQSERKQYLDAQDADLMEALETLLSAIRKIDKETRTRFRETYDKVNLGLQRLFPKIFGGGNAYLELTGTDLLETGVSIIARPPGKKNATIHLLSGGEKSLTAIALIFAIFELNPAPFCMLDEVDAPLDDANVARFANMVKEMSEQVQFIYITHNKVSMEKADQLMGVTMHELGVSRLVSVDVDEAVAMVDV